MAYALANDHFYHAVEAIIEGDSRRWDKLIFNGQEAKKLGPD